jgi:hypothetical protein
MKVFSAKVRGGAIVADAEVVLPEGSTVTIVVDADERSFDLSAEDEAELTSRMDEVDRGEVVPAAELLHRLAQ